MGVQLGLCGGCQKSGQQKQAAAPSRAPKKPSGQPREAAPVVLAAAVLQLRSWRAALAGHGIPLRQVLGRCCDPLAVLISPRVTAGHAGRSVPQGPWRGSSSTGPGS